MAYSTIQNKYTECVDCAANGDKSLKPTISGRCKAYHYKSYRASLMLAKQKEKNKLRSLIQSPKNKEMLAKNGKIPDPMLQLWFAHRMNTLQPICANCGKFGEYLLEEKNKRLWKSCQAHLMPKRHFKSISTHPLNGLILGTGFSGLCHCHDTYDSSWEAASKMFIWEEVCNRFKYLYRLIKPEEHQFIPKQLLDIL